MDNFILLPKPYLSRAIPSERELIDKKVNAELRRVSKLLPAKEATLAIQHGLDLKNTAFVETTKAAGASNLLPGRKAVMNIPVILKQATQVMATKVAGNLTGKAKVATVTSGDFISNEPNGNYSIGYICPLTFTSKLDYERIWGTVISTFVWYFIPADSNGNYSPGTKGIALGIYSKHKNVLTTEETVKWHWDHDLYNKLNYPTVKFKIGVQRYDNNMPGVFTLSDEIAVTFNSAPCINIHAMDLAASHSDGGYPSIKGGDHGTEPTLNVYLNAPAPPGGQIVYLSVSGVTDINPAAWINDKIGDLRIAAGQTHGQWSSIIGSRHVSSTKDIHVVASVNGVEGVSALRITKK